MKQKAIAITGKHERHIQRLGVTQRLLHTRAQGMLVVLCFNHSNWQV